MPAISDFMAVHFKLHWLDDINCLILANCESIPMFLLPQFKKLIEISANGEFVLSHEVIR